MASSFLAKLKPPKFDSAHGLPKENVFNRYLILSFLLYATSAIPLTWDQGSSSAVTSLPSFEKQFGIASATNPSAVQKFLSLVFVGQGAGAALSFLINDRVGRLWSFRIYFLFWTIGQIIAITAPNVGALYAARVISGMGIGALSVNGPMALAEIAPTRIRGLLTASFPVMMGLANMTSTLTVYGIILHMPNSKLGYQIAWFVPCIFMGLMSIASFFLCESPRWLAKSGRTEDAIRTLSKLRGFPVTHPSVEEEMREILDGLQRERQQIYDHGYSYNTWGVVRATFTVPSNLRRFQQALILYALPQLSGANSLTSYFVPILKLVGAAGTSIHNVFLTGMFAMTKFFFALIAALFFIDLLGRRRSLFVGITVQFITDIYLAAFIKVSAEQTTTQGAAQGALAAIFFGSFGYSVGLLTLPYVFGGELWPNSIRSFGAAISQAFHWFFSYAMTYGLPSLLANTDNWGAFVFFAAWCVVGIVYVYFLVPEIAGISTEEMNRLFEGPWFRANKISRDTVTNAPEADVEVVQSHEFVRKTPSPC